MVQVFMTIAREKLGDIPSPERACFGIAGPVMNNTSKLTNLGWLLESGDLQQELQIPAVRLINDFAAVGYGVLGLSANDIHTLKPGQPDPNGAIAIIGAGTGLGQGYVIPYNNGYKVFATEGGHADFAPRTELEYQLMRYLRERLNVERVSVERVVSGRGIESVYQFMRDRQRAQESPEVSQIYKIWQKELGKDEKTVDLAAVISKHALERTDHLCMQAMELFISAYGAEAGNLALKLLPYGGLYIAGGIAAKNLPLIERGEFLEAFSNKGRVSSAIERVPIHVVLNPRVGLIGSALCAAQMAES